MIQLPKDFFARPFAHRGLHDRADGRIENSPSAVTAAVKAGYGIEIDVQLSLDRVAMVFHDYSLQRLTGQVGVIQQVDSNDLAQLTLTDSTDTIRTLPEILKLIAGQVPLLIEIKDQDGAMGPNVGPLECAVARDIADYSGDVAVMSFNPHSIAAFRTYDTTHAVGLVTDPFTQEDWPTIPAPRRAELAKIPDADRLACAFISHNRADLASDAVAAQKVAGRGVCCWTVRSVEQEEAARQYADTITFEGYKA